MQSAYIGRYNCFLYNQNISKNIIRYQTTFKFYITRIMNLKFFQEIKIFWAVEWILYIGLSLVAGWFASGVIGHFRTGKTSFSHHEEEDKRGQIIYLLHWKHKWLSFFIPWRNWYVQALLHAYTLTQKRWVTNIIKVFSSELI